MATLEELNQMASQRYVSPVAEAIIYIGLGDHERALDRLERGLPIRLIDAVLDESGSLSTTRFAPIRASSRC